MKKIRLTRLIVCEYEPKMKYYPKGTTPEQAARIDAKDWKEMTKEEIIEGLQRLKQNSAEQIVKNLKMDRLKYKLQSAKYGCSTCLCNRCIHSQNGELDYCWDCEMCENFDHHTEACDMFESTDDV
jgi:hypothetical protein